MLVPLNLILIQTSTDSIFAHSRQQRDRDGGKKRFDKIDVNLIDFYLLFAIDAVYHLNNLVSYFRTIQIETEKKKSFR